MARVKLHMAQTILRSTSRRASASSFAHSHTVTSKLLCFGGGTTTMGRPLVGEPAPAPEPTLTLVLPGYSHFVLQVRHSSHEAFGLRTHMRPMPNISTEMKYHRQTYPLQHIACSVRLMYRPLPPPPRGDDI